MEKPWILNHVLKEMTDGFYIDINNQKSTELLDSEYRWRGICISKSDIHRSNLCTVLNLDINENIKNLNTILTPNSVGNVIHFMSIKDVNNLELLFDVYYNDTILSHYEHTKHYWRKQIVTLEIFSNTSLSTNLIDKLRECFNLELIYTDNDQFRFVNSIYKILVHT